MPLKIDPDIDGRRYTIGLLLVERFPLLALSALSVALDGANYCSGQTLYDITIYTKDGAALLSSCGTLIQPNKSIASRKPLDVLFVCSGRDPAACCSPEVLAYLRHHARHGAILGGLSSGAYILAQAGLLEDRRVTIHRDHAAKFTAAFPDVTLSNTFIEIDNDRLTSSGGVASLDLAIHMITRDFGPSLAAEVSHHFQLGRIRSQSEGQESMERYSQTNRSWVVVDALRYLRTLKSLAISPSDLADQVGISQRQLTRVFQNELGMTPKRYITELRLEHARELVRTTTMTISDIATSSGFSSRSSFYKSYQDFFGKSPAMNRAVNLQIRAAQT